MSDWVISKRVRRGYNNAASESSHDVSYLNSCLQATISSFAIWAVCASICDVSQQDGTVKRGLVGLTASARWVCCVISSSYPHDSYDFQGLPSKVLRPPGKGDFNLLYLDLSRSSFRTPRQRCSLMRHPSLFGRLDFPNPLNKQEYYQTMNAHENIIVPQGKQFLEALTYRRQQ